MTIEIVDDFVDALELAGDTHRDGRSFGSSDIGPDGSACGWTSTSRAAAASSSPGVSAMLTLPPAYCFRLAVRGAMPSNRFELKLVDPGGTNVWRYLQETLEPDEDWRVLEIPSRQIDFAWGPAGGGGLPEIGAIEIAIVAGSGGRGHLCIADLRMEDRTPPWPPRVLASSALPDIRPAASSTPIRYRLGARHPGRGEAWLTLDFCIASASTAD
jgi:hypothetical protein